MLGIEVKTNKQIKSMKAIIREFLKITPCLFKPFKIPNIIEEVKNIGADSDAINI